MKNNSSSPSERLATLNTRILELEQERTELLRQELANAEQRSQEVASFIGVYNASSGQPGAIPTATRPVSKKRAVKKKATRTAKKSGRSASAKSPKTSGAKAAKGADRLQKAIAVVKKSGAKGISALQLSEKAKIPYSAVRKLLSDSGAFRQQGEKRASRIFLA